jgi:hypothetical protein
MGHAAMQVKAKSLRLVIKVVHFLPAVALEDLLRGVPVSSFIAGLRASPDAATQAGAVVLAELLMAKLGAVYR